MGQPRAQKTKPWIIHMSDYRAIDYRKTQVPASRAGYHKQTKSKKTMFTAMRRCGSPGLIKVRQLGKLCANGAIPLPAYIVTIVFV